MFDFPKEERKKVKVLNIYMDIDKVLYCTNDDEH